MNSVLMNRTIVFLAVPAVLSACLREIVCNGFDDFDFQLMKNISSMIDEKEEGNMGMIDPREIKLGGKRYYRYMGSLTVPPCTEGVIWTIERKVRTVARDQVKLLREAVHDSLAVDPPPVHTLGGIALKAAFSALECLRSGSSVDGGFRSLMALLLAIFVGVGVTDLVFPAMVVFIEFPATLASDEALFSGSGRHGHSKLPRKEACWGSLYIGALHLSAACIDAAIGLTRHLLCGTLRLPIEALKEPPKLLLAALLGVA
ncbi:hypothetical protein RHSIM_Rhsim04G0141200 [Rhododendron simsii]|uniref:Alpha-carbonic anhydrase domain-containing protein n=1 Tax=Rhododendron simsii TaxID=118357 RepID=A0A834H0F2_RHOSS|nr:hypothetical protein RHSIM_Rhsim04G0141200 [Rhododendron simsii]